MSVRTTTCSKIKSCDTGLEIRVLAGCVYLICETTELSVIKFIYHHYFSLAAIAQSVATCYGLDGPRVVSRWGRDFPQPSIEALRPTQLPVQRGTGLFPGGKAAGAWR